MKTNAPRGNTSPFPSAGCDLQDGDDGTKEERRCCFVSHVYRYLSHSKTAELLNKSHRYQNMKLSLVTLLLCVYHVASFSPLTVSSHGLKSSGARSWAIAASGDDWLGDVVSNAGGMVRGCSVRPVGEEPVTKWELTIDGVEADLGKFSEAIYKKIISDARQQRFQGFRPGTIPPHLEPTYRGFSMDECARETVLEAMQQNNIRPFTDARSELVIEKVTIPPPPKKEGKKKKGGGKKKKNGSVGAENTEIEEPAEEETPEPQWRRFEDMKSAIDAGWKPGQSFSFVATNVKGQKVLSTQATKNARPLGADY